MTLVHYFDNNRIELPVTFTNPFRYIPSPAVEEAAEKVMSHIDSSEELSKIFAEGKMLGVLIVKDSLGRVGYLCGFSGNVGGRNVIEGFVPPIYDLLDPNGYFKIKEKEISDINSEIHSLTTSYNYLSICNCLSDSTKEAEESLHLLKEKMAISKQRREELRKTVSDEHTLESLTRESQHEKAEYRRIKKKLEDNIYSLRQQKEEYDLTIAELKNKRKKMSDSLQTWIFDQYIIHNAKGDETTLSSLFDAQGLVPPGGTGECAAPKLLEYAYRHNLLPLSMGEFWYGASPETAVRTHGHFYPSCTSKCGPLLGYMLQGLNVENTMTQELDIPEPVIVYQDEYIVVADKPSGMPSVPGLDNRVSLDQWMENKLGKTIYTVHRLDMDTSGVIIYAFDSESAAHLHRQFEDRTISKEYLARLCPPDDCSLIDQKYEGRIELPLSPDYDERPRQKVDLKNGKSAITDYEVIGTNADMTTDIIFHPITGRTHQLRIHSAHLLGLGRPILGDLLYGAHNALTHKHISKPQQEQPRLHLHARSVTITHPISGKEMRFYTEAPFANSCH